MDDLISRQTAIDALKTCQTYLFDTRDPDKKISLESAVYELEQLPSAHPELNEWCHDCKEYDPEKGCCPRWGQVIKTALEDAKPEIIRCKDCRWWDKYGDYDKGYCMASKHGYWSEHWDINIRRAYRGDFYCADAEPKGEQE